MDDTWELINHPLTDETGLVLAAQMKRQNDILAGIAAGTAGAEFVDRAAMMGADAYVTGDARAMWQHATRYAVSHNESWQPRSPCAHLSSSSW